MKATFGPTTDPELRARRKKVRVEHIPASELPYRLYKGSTGAYLAAYESLDEIDKALLRMSEATLGSKSIKKHVSKLRQRVVKH